MMQSRSQAILGCALAALLCSPMWAAPPQPATAQTVNIYPGTINYVEGQASLDDQSLDQNTIAPNPNGENSSDRNPAESARLNAGQTLSTQNGWAEILLTPGVFFRVNNNSAVQMVSPDLAHTVLTLERGRALVEVANLQKANNLVINQNGAETRILKTGLYDFDADRNQIRVFDGKASVQINGRAEDLNKDHQFTLGPSSKLKAEKFKKEDLQHDDFYRWASLRSSYLTQANVDAARKYAGGTGYAPSPWYGAGWYWDPWCSSYTFIPGGGIFYSPFGYGFYSPGFVYGAPYFGLYGGFYGRPHFGPGYRPPYAFGAYGFGGHAHVYGGGFVGPHPGVSGFHGATGFRSGGFHSGGGFHGGGGHGGGGGHR